MDLLILCCFGGIPFIQYPSFYKQSFEKIRHQWDPTDWVAIDITDSLLFDSSSSSNNNYSFPSLLKTLLPLEEEDISKNLDQCDLWNLTFASNSDKHLFKKNKGKLKCRCPLEYFGKSCQNQKNNKKIINNKSLNNLTKKMTTKIYQENSFVWFLLVFMILAAIMIGLFMMFRSCCFCDCFGGFQNNKNYDQPLDPKTINNCMEAIKKHEKEEKAKYYRNEKWKIALPPPQQQQQQSSLSLLSTFNHNNNSIIIDSRQPLLQQNLIPTISESVQIIPSNNNNNNNIRSCSPPPSYCSS